MDKNIFLEYLDENNIKTAEPMKNHTTFKVGGPADFYVSVRNKEELIRTVEIARSNRCEYMILGKGSNVLVGDKGFHGIIISFDGELSEIKVEGTRIIAGAGATLSAVAKAAVMNSLTGFEFAAGIPGSVGGALFMNAGAYGGEMKDVVTKVYALNSDNSVVNLSNPEMDFGYRHSILKEKQMIALGCELELQKGNEKEIREYMQLLADKRKEKQPLEYPSAGSTFKRPTGFFAGKLIEDSGLGGYSVGGAEVSMKHKGFVINKNNATASDIKTLIGDVQRIVEEKQGVRLEPEVIFLGEF